MKMFQPRWKAGEDLIKAHKVVSSYKGSSLEMIDFIHASTANYGKVKRVLQTNRSFCRILISRGKMIFLLYSLLLLLDGSAGILMLDIHVLSGVHGNDGFTISRSMGEIENGHNELLNEAELAAAAEEKKHIPLKYTLLSLSDLLTSESSHQVNPDLDIELKPQAQPRPYQEKSLSKMFGNGRILDCIASALVENVKQRCLPNALNYPMLEEYDFRNDIVNPDLDMELKPQAQPRPYQDKSLSKMFGNGRIVDYIASMLVCEITKHLAMKRAVYGKLQVIPLGIIWLVSRDTWTVVTCKDDLAIHIPVSRACNLDGDKLSSLNSFLAAEGSSRLELDKYCRMMTVMVLEMPCILLEVSSWCLSAACRIKKSCLCLATNAVSVDQWAFQFKLWSTIQDEQVCRFTSDSKERFRGNAGLVVTTYNMVAFGGKRSEKSEKIIEEIENGDCFSWMRCMWFLLTCLERSSALPNPTANLDLLVSTLVIEDERITDLNFLIGPKLYEANWLDLVKGGFIANVECAEVWCPMTKEFFAEYLKKENSKKRQVGDNSIDIPEANVMIQISSHAVLRRKEKPNDSVEMYYSTKGQQFLIDQGYSFKVITSLPPPDSGADLIYRRLDEQLALLGKVLNVGDDAVGLELLKEDTDDIAFQKARRSVGSMSALSGAKGMEDHRVTTVEDDDTYYDKELDDDICDVDGLNGFLDDHVNWPLGACADGQTFLDTFSPLYKVLTSL
ncbi:DNA repair helicase XPB1-like protein [Actinidia rufa]|uniref:DNA repair helicase XPB1-like protein n=1 Tax=Actinidia rufa TaxID=165716 RepID=A0A7J0G7W3_9ERIC|nr:DNA repair helicase XPB1-like protein [Actinidia rufa]